jgi:hypothetical protein
MRLPTHPTTPTPTTTTSTTSPPPTTTTTPPPPPGWDLDLSMATRHLWGDKYRGTMTIGAPAQAKDVTVTVAVNKILGISFRGAGWSCTPVFNRSIAVYTCTAGVTSPPDLVATVKFHPRAKDAALTATVSVPGNDDPDLSNNTAALQR